LIEAPDGVPLGYVHPDLFLELLPNKFNIEAVETLRIGYVLLAAYYFLLDAIVDGHLKNPMDALYISHLTSGAYSQFRTACAIASPDSIAALDLMICQHLAENAQAIRDESVYFSSPLMPADSEEIDSITGRSNAILLLYRTLCLFAGSAANQVVISLIKRLIYFIQLIDDLGDWREDYRAGRYTSVLRYSFSRRGRILSESKLENDLLLGGIFEVRCGMIINSLDALASSAADNIPRSLSLQSYIAGQRCRVYNELRARLEIKNMQFSLQHKSNALCEDT
jgi:hypothetical protein